MTVLKWSNLDCFWWMLFTATLANSRQRLRWCLCWSYRLLADPSVVPGHSLHWLSRFCRIGGLRDCPKNKEEICLGHQKAATNLTNITNKQESTRLVDAALTCGTNTCGDLQTYRPAPALPPISNVLHLICITYLKQQPRRERNRSFLAVCRNYSRPKWA